jgi:chromosomal replication initiation ATPase DnaA
MRNTIILDRKIENILPTFPKVIANEKWMKMKKMKGDKFELISTDKFEVNMIEKEHYHVLGQLISSNNQTQINYKVRANDTFKILSFVIPLMAFPTLLIGMMSAKSNTHDNSQFLPNIFIYLLIVFLSTSIFFYQDRKLRLKGDKHFRNLIKNLEDVSVDSDKIK